MISADELKAFYSWQSDLPENENRYFIKGILEESIKKLNVKINENIRIDESLANTSGSPDIKSTVLHKIENSSFFIADVSICSKNEKGKYLSNSNVMFELGYAVAHLGWNRIILLINEDICKPEELPFDIRGHGVLPYTIKKRASFVNQMQKELEKIHSLPIAKKLLDKDKIKRDRDIENLTHLFTYIDFFCLEYYFREGPSYLTFDLLDFFDNLKIIYNSMGFFLYNEEIKSLLEKIYQDYKEITSHPDMYDSGNNNRYYLIKDTDYKKIHDFTNSSIKTSESLKKNLDLFIKVIRKDYLEIDIEKCFAEARKRNKER